MEKKDSNVKIIQIVFNQILLKQETVSSHNNNTGNRSPLTMKHTTWYQPSLLFVYLCREFSLVITSSDTFLCYISANTSSERDSNSNSVTQNEPAVHEDSNSVKQNKSNSTDIEHDWSKDIEKVQFFLKKELAS